MRNASFTLAWVCAIGLAGPMLAPGAARAGVPRSCIHPRADSLVCPRDARSVTNRVLPAARIRALRRQERSFERVVPREERPRYRTLDELRAGLRRSD